jgi:hypothetical protein
LEKLDVDLIKTWDNSPEFIFNVVTNILLFIPLSSFPLTLLLIFKGFKLEEF